jgi:PAN domain
MKFSAGSSWPSAGEFRQSSTRGWCPGGVILQSRAAGHYKGRPHPSTILVITRPFIQFHFDSFSLLVLTNRFNQYNHTLVGVRIMTLETMLARPRLSLKMLCIFGLLVLDFGSSSVSAQQVGTRQPGTRQPGQAPPVQQPIAPPPVPVNPPPAQANPGTAQPGSQAQGSPGTNQPGGSSQGSPGTNQPGGSSQGSPGTNQPGGPSEGIPGTNQPGGAQVDAGTVTTLPGSYGGPADLTKSLCPHNDLRTYSTPTGTFFMIQCGRKHLTPVIQRTTAKSLRDCADKCGEEPTCKSVSFHLTGDAVCTLFSGTGASTTDAEKDNLYNYAFVIDPPTEDVKDEELVACSTTCPSGKSTTHMSCYLLTTV